MIFGVAVKEPKLFLMLSEKDIQGMREGQTRFVDERATQGATFNGVIVSLHKTDQEALALMQRFSIPRLPRHPRASRGGGAVRALQGDHAF